MRIFSAKISSIPLLTTVEIAGSQGGPANAGEGTEKYFFSLGEAK